MAEFNPREFINDLARKRARKLKDEEFRKMVERILGVWSDPNHVLIELVQNADDAKAKWAKFILDGKDLLFLHDGKPFSRLDVKRICSVALTTKKIGSYIGFFGIGFKSVFKISHKPHIFSFPFKFFFRRESPVVPEWVEEIPSKVKRYLNKKITVFYLPLRTDMPKRTIEKLKDALLKDFDSLSLAFLRHLKQIEFIVDKEERILKIKKGRFRGQLIKTGRVTIIELMNREEKNYDYLLFRKTVNVSPIARSDYLARETRKSNLKKLDLILAFKLRGKNNLERIEGKLFTFLPTQIKTGLKFILNSDFILDTSRSNIDWSSKWNLWLLEAAGKFIQEVIPKFKEDKKLQKKFYKVLPRREEIPEKFFDYLAAPVLDYCRRNPIVITSNEKWVKPSDVVFASPRFQRLIPVKKTGYKFYVHSRVEGKEFLKAIGVKELDERETLFKILQDKAFLQGQSKEWFKRLYEFLYDSLYTKKGWKIPIWEIDEVEDRLKRISFILTSDGRLERPLNVVLPPKRKKQLKYLSNLPKVGSFIDSEVITKKSLQLFKNLDCRSFSRETVGRLLIEGYKNGSWEKWTEPERMNSLLYLKSLFESIKWNLPSDLKTDLIFIRVPTENAGWERADKCYFPEPTLEKIFPESPFIKKSLLEGKRRKEWMKFLTRIGVLNYPRMIKIDEKCNRWNAPKGITKDKWDSYWTWIEPYIEDIKWEGYGHHLESVYLPEGFMESLGNEKSVLYFNYILKYWREYYRKYLYSSYIWHYYKPRSKKVPSFFAFLLKTSSWLPTNEGVKAPSPDVFIPTKEIRRVAGHIVAYLCLQENLIKQGQDFFEFLGLSTKIDFQTVLLLLKKAENMTPDEKLKLQLERIYDVFSELINGEKLEEDIKILSDDHLFLPPKSLYWNDDEEMGRLLQDKVKFAWIPTNLPKPKINKIFKFLGVKKLSESLNRTLIVDSSETLSRHHKIEKLLKKKSKFIYSILANFQAKKLDEAPDFLRSVQAYKMRRLRVLLKVKDVEVAYESKAFCDVEGRRLYLAEDAGLIDISIELARSFGLPLEHVFILNWALGQTSLEHIIKNFGRFGIPIIELPAEEEVYKPMPTRMIKVMEEPPTVKSEETVKPFIKRVEIETQEMPMWPSVTKPSKEQKARREKIESVISEASQRVIPVYRSTGSPEKRHERERWSMKWAMEFERAQGRKPEDVSMKRIGYDIKSTDDKTGKIRYIEVKTSVVQLTDDERITAERLGEEYFLYVVWEHDGKIFITEVCNPVKNCELKEVYTPQWKVIDWKNKGKTWEIG